MAINLGSIFNSGGKTVVSGGSSQLDTESLIESLVEAKRLPAVRLENTIESNTEKMDALGELSSILENFRDAANFLRNPPGVGNAEDNIFNYRSATISSNIGTDGGSYLSATVGAGDDNSSYNLTVDQIATRQTRVTNTFAAADTSASVVGGGGPFNAGTMVLGVDGTEITLEDGDSLAVVVAKINAVKGESGVEATTVKVSDGQYRITMKAVDTGTDQNFDFTAANPGILNAGFFSETDAVNAQVTIDGTQVERQSNNIDDLIDGVSLNLTQTTPPGVELTVGIKSDTQLARSAIMNFVDAYNEFRVFAARQNETNDDGERVGGAILGSNSSMRQLINAISSEMTGAVAGLGDMNSLAAIGLKLTDFPGDDETPFTRNILQVDEGKLDAALASNYDDVRKIFEFDYVTDDPNFVIFSRSNNLAANDVTFNIDQTNGVYEAVVNGNTITLTATPLTSGGVSLAAPDDSALAGLNVLYTDTGDATVNVSMTQGIGDRIFNTLENAMDDENGIVAREINSFKERNDRLQADIDRLDNMIENYRISLLEKFSALEEALASVNSILQLLDAQADARANS